MEGEISQDFHLYRQMEEELPLQRDGEIVFPGDEPPNLLVKTKW